MRLLLLAGTQEARGLARALAERPGIDAVASFSGAVARPAALPLRVRRGGFGGAEGFAAYLREHSVAAVLDATHPFAARMGPRSAAVCRALGLPYLRLWRPPWRPGAGDDWHNLSQPEEAAAIIPLGATVFMATGGNLAPRLAGLAGRRLIWRRIEAPGAGEAPLPPGSRVILGRPPFDPAAEAALLAGLGADWLVAKNAGGQGGLAKLEAARRVGLPVAMLDRPPPPDAPRVASQAEALAWVLDLARGAA